MSTLSKRFAKLVVAAAILSTGILPISCATRLGEAAWDGVATWTTGTVLTTLSSVVPLNLLGL